MSDETIELPKNDLEIMVDGQKKFQNEHLRNPSRPWFLSSLPLMDTYSESPHLLCLRHSCVWSSLSTPPWLYNGFLALRKKALTSKEQLAVIGKKKKKLFSSDSVKEVNFFPLPCFSFVYYHCLFILFCFYLANWRLVHFRQLIVFISCML